MNEFEDHEMMQAFYRDERKLHAGKRKHTCPDCGTKNALTDEQKLRGYHCHNCTKAIEEGF